MFGMWRFVKYILGEFQPWVKYFLWTCTRESVAVFEKHAFFSELFFKFSAEVIDHTEMTIKHEIFEIRKQARSIL